MTDPTPIREPGVDIVQSARTTPAAVSSPVLMPVLVFPCKKILEVTLPDGSLNDEARIQLPALYQPHLYLNGVSPTGAYVLVAPEVIEIEVDHGPSKSITFAIGSWTLNSALDWLNSEIGRLGLAIRAVKVDTSSTLAFLRLQTTTLGEAAHLKVTWTSATTVLADGLKLPRTWESSGYDQYSNDRLLLTEELLPDPWSLRPDLDLVESSVRTFLTSDSAVKKELYRDSAVSRAGQSFLDMLDDGDGDGTTPLLLFKASAGAQLAYPTDIADMLSVAQDDNLPDFDAVPTSAVLVNTTVPAWGVAITALDFWVQIDGWAAQHIQLADPAGILQAAVLDAINDRFPRYAPDTAVAIDDPITAGAIRLRSFRFGRESSIRVWGTSAVTLFGAGTYPKIWRGNYQQVRVGDEIWVDGTLLGVISQIVDGGAAGVSDAQVRLDREYAVTYFDHPTTGVPTKHTWWIVSKELTAQVDASLVTDLTTPELYVSNYLIQLRHDALRGNLAQPLYPTMNTTVGKAHAPVFYEALRLDVTAKATTRDAEPVVIEGNDFDGLLSQFEPLDAQNPLGLAGFFALQNSGIVPVALLGVDEVSEDFPDGTPEAYARAFAVLQSFENTYAISVLSKEYEIGELLSQHVTFMSRAKQAGERIGFVTTEIPDRDEPELVGSGTKGNAAVPGAYPATATFETNLVDLSDLFLQAGVTKTVFDTDGSDGVYLNIEGDSKNYMVLSYTGTTLTCTPVYTTPDTFWARDALGVGTLWSAAIIDKTFSVSVRGQLLLDTADLPDKDAIVRAIGRRAKRYLNKRIICGAPGEVEAVIGGLSQRISSSYLAAATAAQRCAFLPSKPQSKSPVIGFDKVIQANGYFRPEQMDTAAGYGVWWWANNPNTGRVITRMQLTTDVSSVLTRELSVISSIDYGRKVVRSAISPITGTITITPSSTQQVSILAQGAFDFLKSTGVWLDVIDPKLTVGPFVATPEDIAEGLGDGDEDEALLEFEVVLPKPLNRVRVRMLVS